MVVRCCRKNTSTSYDTNNACDPGRGDLCCWSWEWLYIFLCFCFVTIEHVTTRLTCLILWWWNLRINLWPLRFFFTALLLTFNNPFPNHQRGEHDRNRPLCFSSLTSFITISQNISLFGSWGFGVETWCHGICDRREGKKRAVVGLFRAGLRGENGAKHLNLDNSQAKQLAPAPLADSTRLDICSHLRHCPRRKACV